MSKESLEFSQLIYNYISPFIGLITIIWIVRTFNLQNIQLQSSKQAFIEGEVASNRKQFEDSFYLFLKIYRDNVKEMKISSGLKGREVFVFLKKEFEEIFSLVKNQVKTIEVPINSSELIEKDIIKISYTIFFFGIDDESNKLLRNSLKEYHFYLDKILLALKESKKTSLFLFEGHQSRLGHYYRHLFHTVNFVHDTKLLQKNSAKHFYMLRLLGQLSAYEQSLLFLNSFSKFGEIWQEYSKDGGKPIDLITEYQIIKNIRSGFFNDIDHRAYYSKIKYQGV